MNVHFKKPTAGYAELFEQMTADGTISTRGTKEDAYRYGELIFDVNSAYFYNHGGYEFAKQFYHEAYRAAIEIVGGEQYILPAVMHADERNRAMSEALGEDVYHYHLHVVYVPVVEKQILWSKRCKDKSLVGTVKETVMQVSMSKKWASKAEARLETARELDVTYSEIKQMSKKTLTGNVTFTPKEASTLKTLAQEALGSRTKLYRLEDALTRAKHDAKIWKKRYNSLMEKVAPFLVALERAPKRVMEFLREVINREPEHAEARTVKRKREISTER